MKKLLIALLFFAALPLTSLAQTWFTPGYDGSPESYYDGWAAGNENIVRISPTLDSLRLDSVGFYLYRATTSVANTLNYRILIYSRDGTISGGCGCTTGPGTILKQYPSSTTTYQATWSGTNTGAQWVKQLVPSDTIAGSFLIGIRYVSKTTGTYPSILFDDAAYACCDEYIKYGGVFYDNDDAFGVGPFYIAVKGTAFGAVTPGHLTISSLEGMAGAVVDSTVDDTLVLGNSGGTSLTISSIISDNADFWTDPVGAGIVIPPAGSYNLAVHFMPSAAGDASATLTFTDNTPTVTTTKVLAGRGIDPTNLMLFENWWNGNGYASGWSIESFGAEDTTDAQWSLFYNGSHSDGYTNVWAEHGYSPATDTLLDILGSPTMIAPAGGTVTVNFRDRVDFPSYYMGHFLALADSDTVWTLLNELDVVNEGEWGDYPVTYYVTGLDSEYAFFHIGFTYYGADADDWLVDDIMIKDVPQVPPFLASEPRGDAFSTDQELVAECWDSNSDPFTLTAYISANGGPFQTYAMPLSTGSTYCLPFTSFVSGAGSYTYYLEAVDDDGSTRFPDTGDYAFEVVAQTGATQITYHDGAWNNAHFYYNMAAEEAVRFTPSEYPFIVTGATVSILNYFPNAVHEHIVVKVYDDDGTGGLPGTLLYEQETGSIGNECDGLGEDYAMYEAKAVINPNVVINDGTFYVSIKNPASATNTLAEAWCLDTLGTGTSYYYDPTAATWSVLPDSVGDVMISALGYTPPTPILTVYPNTTNTGVNIHVDGTAGSIPPTNIYVSTTIGGTESLLSGSPFTTSPIEYLYTGDSRVFFSATQSYGPTALLRYTPPAVEPDYPVTSVRTARSTDVSVAANRDGELRVNTAAPVVAPVVFSQPTVVAVNNVTGEKSVSTIGKRLGKAKSVTPQTEAAVRGPVRTKVDARSFSEAVLAR